MAFRYERRRRPWAARMFDGSAGGGVGSKCVTNFATSALAAIEKMRRA
jgi:hypothetical protein